MARNYKRARNGQFAKVAGSKGSNPRGVKPTGTSRGKAVSSHKAARAAIKRRKATSGGPSGGRKAANILIATAAVTAGAIAVDEASRAMSGPSPRTWVDGKLLGNRRRGAYNITTLR